MLLWRIIFASTIVNTVFSPKSSHSKILQEDRNNYSICVPLHYDCYLFLIHEKTLILNKLN